MSTFHSVAIEALALDPADRLRLATELIDSVEGPEDPEWAAAWTAEIHRRSTEADAQATRGSSWADVRARLLKDRADR